MDTEKYVRKVVSVDTFSVVDPESLLRYRASFVPERLFVSIDEYSTVRHEWVLMSQGTECHLETRALAGRLVRSMLQTCQNAHVHAGAGRAPRHAQAAYLLVDRTIEALTIARRQIAQGWFYSDRMNMLEFLLEGPWNDEWHNAILWVKGATERDIMLVEDDETAL